MPDVKIIEQWAAALESGKYQQARNTLQRVEPYEHARTDPGFDADNSTVGFCCLGVLCELAVAAGVVTKEDWGDTSLSNGKSVRYGGSESFLPVGVVEWAGLDSHNPSVRADFQDEGGAEYERVVALADLNDMYHKDFGYIAKAIRGQFLADAQPGSPA